MKSQPRSPRLRALQAAMASGQLGAEAAFWREIEMHGTPLVEPAHDAERFALLTFIWHGDGLTRNVFICSSVGRYDPLRDVMRRLPGTDLWYATYEVPRGLRTAYQLAPNDPLTPLADAPDPHARTAGWVADPLNPRTFVLPRDEEDPDDHDARFSVIELPDADPQPWIEPRPQVPAGTMEEHRLVSAILGNERRVWLYSPPGYDAERAAPYPLVIMFDGFAALHVIPTPTILDNLIADGCIPPVLAVLIDSLGEQTRRRELLCHEPFNAFLIQELLPWAQARRHATGSAAETMLVGQSAGGVAAAFAALRHPERFGLVLTQSGAFWWAPPNAEPCWLTREYVAAPRLPIHFALDVGQLERISGRPSVPTLLGANRHLRDVLLARGYRVARYAEFSGGHDYLCWRGTLADGLIALLGSGEAGVAERAE